jgi:hypothetical protein
MRRLTGIVVTALVVGAICWFFGLDVMSSLVIALVIVAAGVAWRALPESGPTMDWPVAPAPGRDGNRRETSQLSWSLRTGFGAVDDRIVARIRRIAVNRLALRQLDLDNPGHRSSIERLIGEDVYELVSSERTRPVRLVAINHALDILDALGHDPAPHASSPAEPQHQNPVSQQ